MDFDEQEQNPIPEEPERIVIAGDVSATNVLMGVFALAQGIQNTVLKGLYRGAEISNFPDVVSDLMERAQLRPDQVAKMVLSPAGPISSDGKRAEMTLANFSLDIEQMPVKTVLINDFLAIGYAVSDLRDEIEHVRLKHADGGYGEPIDREPIAIIGAGTGLGMARLFYDRDKGRYVPYSSEGGHMILAADIEEEEDIDIVRSIFDDVGGKRPSYNDTVSGRGIARIYSYIRQKQGIDEDTGEDTAAFVAGKAKADPASVHGRVMDVFWNHYGTAMRNIAVHEVARGGLWIAGGIIRKNIMDGENVDARIESRLMSSYINGSHHYDWLSKIPVYAIMDAEIGLKGALQLALREG